MRLFSLTRLTFLLLCCLLAPVANGFNRKAWLKTPVENRKCGCSFCGGEMTPFIFGKFGLGTNQVDETRPKPGTPEAPIPPIGNSHVLNTTTIQFLISSFRDPRCGQSVYNVFRRAKYPDRISIGVVDQTLAEKDKFDCLSTYCALWAKDQLPGNNKPCPNLDRISIVRVDAREAQGPVWARAIGSTMVKPDMEFCMQVDAHVDFQKDFDVTLMKMWAMTANEYGVLSTYVGNLIRDLSAKGEMLIGLPMYDVPILCEHINGGNGVRRVKGADGTKCLTKPLLGRAWAAGWSFAKCHMERNVPNDPGLSGFFDGEEYSRFLRMWTHGYDVYTPHRPVVFHDYRHGLKWQGGREHTWSAPSETIAAARKRYSALVGRAGPAAQAGLMSYGIGKQRSLEQLHKFSGMKPADGSQLNNPAIDCGRLKYVPFKHDPSKRAANLPVYFDGRDPSKPEGSTPPVVPGVRSDGTDPFPVITSQEYVEIARGMREVLKNESPKITHKQQMIEFGQPAPQFWDDMIAEHKKTPAAGKATVGLQQQQHAQSLPVLRGGIESLPGLKTGGGMDSSRKVLLILWLVGMCLGGLMLKRRMGRSKAS